MKLANVNASGFRSLIKNFRFIASAYLLNLYPESVFIKQMHPASRFSIRTSCSITIKCTNCIPRQTSLAAQYFFDEQLKFAVNSHSSFDFSQDNILLDSISFCEWQAMPRGSKYKVHHYHGSSNTE